MNSPENLPLHRATVSELDVVYGIILEAAEWLQSRNIPQWNWFSTDKGKSLVRHRIENAETYLIFDTLDRPAATFTLQWEDEQIWGSRGNDGLAGYVHGLAVARRAAGKGLGLAMIAHASARIAEKSRALIRLDCDGKNAALCNYYRQAGFVEAGLKEVLGFAASEPISIQLFERSINT